MKSFSQGGKFLQPTKQPQLYNGDFGEQCSACLHVNSNFNIFDIWVCVCVCMCKYEKYYMWNLLNNGMASLHRVCHSLADFLASIAGPSILWHILRVLFNCLGFHWLWGIHEDDRHKSLAIIYWSRVYFIIDHIPIHIYILTHTHGPHIWFHVIVKQSAPVLVCQTTPFIAKSTQNQQPTNGFPI